MGSLLDAVWRGLPNLVYGLVWVAAYVTWITYAAIVLCYTVSNAKSAASLFQEGYVSKYKSEEAGPTWEDVYDYVHRLEHQFDKTIFLQMRLFKNGKPERLCGSATAHAVPPGKPLVVAKHIGTHGFKGQSGARTAPGAFWHALADLEGRLEGIEKVAQERMPF